MCEFSKLEHVAHYKLKNEESKQSKQTDLALKSLF